MVERLGTFLYHGTHEGRAKRILREGFRVGKVDIYGDGDPYDIGYGNLGRGTYLTSNWRIALWYGRAILRVRLIPGTRTLQMAPWPEERVLRYLTAEFGRTLLEVADVWTVLPRNKRLTLEEHVALLTYHYRRTERYFWSDREGPAPKRRRRLQVHVDAMHSLGTALSRFGIHGFGQPDGWTGLLVHDPARIVAEEHILTVDSKYYQQLLQTRSEDVFLRLPALAALPRATRTPIAAPAAWSLPSRTRP